MLSNWPQLGPHAKTASSYLASHSHRSKKIFGVKTTSYEYNPLRCSLCAFSPCWISFIYVNSIGDKENYYSFLIRLINILCIPTHSCVASQSHFKTLAWGRCDHHGCWSTTEQKFGGFFLVLLLLLQSSAYFFCCVINFIELFAIYTRGFVFI